MRSELVRVARWGVVAAKKQRPQDAPEMGYLVAACRPSVYEACRCWGTPIWCRAGDGNLVTMDALWNLKVIRPKPFHTLQVCMWCLMRQRRGALEFLSVRRIGLFNPRLHVSYVLDVDSIAEDVKEAVECEVMGYDSPNPWDSVAEPDRLM